MITKLQLTAGLFGFLATASGAHAADQTSVAAPPIRAGDAWVYDQTMQRGTSGFGEEKLDLKIERVADDTMVVGVKRDGAPTDYEDHIAGRDWSLRRVVDGRETITGRPLAFPLSVGKTWASDFTDPSRHGLQTTSHTTGRYRVTGWEDVTVPAGTFHALRIEENGAIEARFAPAAGAVASAIVADSQSTAVTHTQAAGAHTAYETIYSVFDYAPEVHAVVKSVEENYNSENVRTRRNTRSLVSFKLAEGAGAGAGGSADASPSVGADVEWDQRPNAVQMAALFPAKARTKHVIGEAAVDCTVNAAGGLDACSVGAEAPAGYGFGDASLKAARLYRARPSERASGTGAAPSQVTIKFTWAPDASVAG